ncbi:hypothetical protein JGU66_22215 [Myxococcaceae bacterium JPH2]|nr:hypothetical protein [Myxococcaceae bacterium JPH2]
MWLVHEGTPQDDLAQDLAVDASGDLLTASVEGVDGLQSHQPSDDTVRLVLTRRSPDGANRWVKTFEVRVPATPPTLRADIRVRLAADGAGNLLMAGNVHGTVDLGSGPLHDTAFLAKLDSTGTLQWVSTPQGAAVTFVDVAVDAGGQARVAFNTSGGVDFGGARASRPGVVAYTPDGHATATVMVGQPDRGDAGVALTTVALDASGRAIVAGNSQGPVHFGAQSTVAQKEGSPFVAVYDASGTLAWVRVLQSARGTVDSVGVSAAGEVLAAGAFLGGISWGDAHLSGPPPRLSAFVLAVGADGTEHWAHSLGSDVQVGALAVRPTGEATVAGFTYSMLENGAASQDGLGAAQLFTLGYDATGQSLASRLYLAEPPIARGELFGLEAVPAMAVLADGDAVLFGHSDRDTDFGTGHQTPARSDVFLLRVKH